MGAIRAAALYEDSDSLRSIAWIRFAQLLRLGQTARRQTLRHLPYVRKRKQPAKNAGASLAFRPFGCFLLLSSGFWLRVRLWAVRPFRVGFVSGGGVVRFPLAFAVSAVFLWLLWLAFAVRVLCRRRFRRWFRRAFRRLFLPLAALRLAVLPALTVSLCRRLAVWARRFLCFRLRRLVLGAVRLRGVRRLWSRRLLRRARAAVWSLLFLRLVRSVCFLLLRLRAAFPVLVRVRGLRSLLPSGAAFQSLFFRAFRRAFPLLRFCPLRGRVRGFLPVPVVGHRAFVLCLLCLPCFLFSCLFSYI